MARRRLLCVNYFLPFFLLYFFFLYFLFFLFRERIFDHGAKTETNVYYDQQSVSCFVRALNTTLPKPDFSKYQYVGKALVAYVPALLWSDREFRTDGFEVLYFESQVGRNPMKFEVHDLVRSSVMEFNYMEFDGGKEDRSLFTLPAAITSVCNKVN